MEMLTINSCSARLVTKLKHYNNKRNLVSTVSTNVHKKFYCDHVYNAIQVVLIINHKHSVVNTVLKTQTMNSKKNQIIH